MPEFGVMSLQRMAQNTKNRAGDPRLSVKPRRYGTGTLHANVGLSIDGRSAGRAHKGVFHMFVRFASGQQIAFSVVGALLCTVVLINVATSLVPVA